MKHPWVAEGGDDPYDIEPNVLRSLGNLQSPDQVTAIKVVHLSFLDTIEWWDSDTMRFLATISVSDPEGFIQLLSSGSLASVDETPVQLLYLEIKDPAAAEQLAAQEWVKDGRHYGENATLNYLQESAIVSKKFFSYLIEGDRTWIPVYTSLDHSALSILVKWSHFDEDAVLPLAGMPFMNTIEITDHQAVLLLYKLAGKDPEAVQRILSRPMVRDGVTDEEAIQLVLFYLEESSPEAAAAIRDLPWVRDGIAYVPHNPNLGSVNVFQNIEDHEIIHLVDLATSSPDFLIELTNKEWIRDSINENEGTTVSSFYNIVRFDEAAAFRVLRLRLLDTHNRQTSRAVDRLFSATFEGREAFERVLEELEAVGGS